MDPSSKGAPDTTLSFRVLLTLAIALRLYLLVATPVGQAVAHRLEGLNDEPAHVNYVRYLVAHRAFPVQAHHYREPGAFARGDYEYYQAPLYYSLAAPFVAAVGPRLAPYACRLVAFVCGLLSLVVLGRLLAQLRCPPSWRRMGVVFVALLPTHAYFTSLASNDSLSWLIGLILTAELVAMVRTRGSPRANGVRLGLLLAAGLLTKSSLVLFLPVALLLYVHRALASRRASALTAALLPLSLVLVIAGPWYARNQILYGSPMALSVGFGPPDASPSLAPSLAHTLTATVRYFWFPMQHVSRSAPVLVIRWLGAAVLPFHALAALLWFRRRPPATAGGVVLVLILWSALVSVAMLGRSWGDIEGRFLMPALGSIAFFLTVPVLVLAGPGRERLAWVYLTALAVHPWALLAFA